ncbi:MAG: response regulator [Candidatus Riflebacteria bacterium]|nr:response regulator [Candidatus Riflebacteria bacterium]
MKHDDQDVAFLKTLTVLLVENDNDAREQLSYLLQHHVGKVIDAENGVIGLEEFRAQHPHMVITDIRMPEMDGLTMTEEIRKINSYVPVLLTTSYERSDYMMRSIDIGIDKYIVKPIDTDQLISALLECTHFIQFEEQRRKTEEQLHEFNSELEERVHQRTIELASINKELETFCNYISHDLRAPIARLEGFGKILMECALNADYRPILHIAERVVFVSREMKKVTDNMLIMTRLSQNRATMDWVNVSELAQNIMANLLKEAGTRIIKVKITPDLVVRGNQQMVGICLQNILDNAVKFSANTFETAIELGEVDDSGKKVFYVKDNGAGFDEKFGATLFLPSVVQNKISAQTTSGFGLKIAQRIIEWHGGRIWAIGSPGDGATFFFTFGEG